MVSICFWLTQCRVERRIVPLNEWNTIERVWTWRRHVLVVEWTNTCSCKLQHACRLTHTNSRSEARELNRPNLACLSERDTCFSKNIQRQTMLWPHADRPIHTWLFALVENAPSALEGASRSLGVLVLAHSRSSFVCFSFWF